jgi:hypothetical protein
MKTEALESDLVPPVPSIAYTPNRTVVGRIELLALAALLMAVVVTLQWLGGAFTAELAGYPDEASHYMAGLLVSDYLHSGFAANPIAFATRFYLHYPYLAIGHWPPLFYCVEGLWIFMFGSSRSVVLLLMAMITVALATLTYVEVRRMFGWMFGLAAALLFISIPVVQQYAGMVMMDTLLSLLSLWTILCFARFLETGGWRDGMQFALFASLAILTKGNAFFLALVPALGILFSRRFYLLKRPAFWAQAGVVAVLGVPWHLLTMHMMLPTFGDHLGASFTQRASSFYGALLLRSLGAPLLALALAGVVTRVIKPLRNTGAAPIWASFGAFLTSLVLFYCLVPAGIEARYTIAVFPILIIFAIAGAVDLGRWARFGSVSSARRAGLVFVAALLCFVFTSFNVPAKESYGFRTAVEQLAPALKTPSIIVVSTDRAVGEGAFVAEMAMRGNRGHDIIVRGSQVLADSNWDVTRYRPRYASAEDLNQSLKASGVDYLVLDTSPNLRHYIHQQQLVQLVEQHPEDWQVVSQAGNLKSNWVKVYRASVQAVDKGRDPLCSIKTNLTGKAVTWPIQIMLAAAPEAANKLTACRSIQ